MIEAVEREVQRVKERRGRMTIDGKYCSEEEDQFWEGKERQVRY